MDVSKCDIVRAAAAATIGGACSSSTPPPDCYTTDLASKWDMYVQTKYSPAGLLTADERAVRERELQILEDDMDADLAQIQAKYGHSAPVAITWNDFGDCLWNPDGAPGGPHNNEYFEREDLLSLGYQPQPIFGGAALENWLPESVVGQVPVWLDHFFNPDLLVVLIFALLVVLFAVMLYTSYKRKQEAPILAAKARAARRQKMEASDPYRGTKFESYPADPDVKWEELIPLYEAQGYCMEAYRKKFGMPVTDHCA